MATEPPATIELCPRCLVHRLHVSWCYHCGFKGEGLVYTLTESPVKE